MGVAVYVHQLRVQNYDMQCGNNFRGLEDIHAFARFRLRLRPYRDLQNALSSALVKSLHFLRFGSDNHQTIDERGALNTEQSR